MRPWCQKLGKLYVVAVVMANPQCKRTSNAPQTHLKRTSNEPQTNLKRAPDACKTDLKRNSNAIKLHLQRTRGMQFAASRLFFFQRFYFSSSALPILFQRFYFLFQRFGAICYSALLFVSALYFFQSFAGVNRRQPLFCFKSFYFFSAGFRGTPMLEYPYKFRFKKL